MNEVGSLFFFQTLSFFEINRSMRFTKGVSNLVASSRSCAFFSPDLCSVYGLVIRPKVSSRRKGILHFIRMHILMLVFTKWSNTYLFVG